MGRARLLGCCQDRVRWQARGIAALMQPMKCSFVGSDFDYAIPWIQAISLSVKRFDLESRSQLQSQQRQRQRFSFVFVIVLSTSGSFFECLLWKRSVLSVRT